MHVSKDLMWWRESEKTYNLNKDIVSMWMDPPDVPRAQIRDREMTRHIYDMPAMTWMTRRHWRRRSRQNKDDEALVGTATRPKLSTRLGGHLGLDDASEAATNDEGATRLPCKTARSCAADVAARLPGMPRRQCWRWRKATALSRCTASSFQWTEALVVRAFHKYYQGTSISKQENRFLRV